MELHITFFASVIETLTIYFIIKLLDKANSMPIHKVFIFVSFVAIGITIADANGLPFQFLFTFISCTALLILLLKRNIVLLFIDLMIASGLFVFLQLLASIIIDYFHGNILESEYLLFTMLLLFSFLFYILGSYNKSATLITKFYTANRDSILWIAINLFFCILIISHIWSDLDEFFWTEQWTILLLTIIIYVLNGGLLISFLHRKKQKEKIRGYQEYGEYLEEMMHQLSSRQHEFANQINVMMGLAQTKKGDNLSQAIMEYGERILDEKKRASKEAIICDDSMISAMLYRKMTEAKKENIQFEYLIERPFPKYTASAYDLVELLVNLINNAFEAVATLEEEDRQVFLKINTGHIEILNTIPNNFDDASIAKFSQTGYSTKGKQRGYGVSNIKTIINRYHGQLDISRQENIIVFSILLP